MCMFMSMCCFSFLWQWLLVASKHCLPLSCFCQQIQPRNPELQEGYYKCPECTCWFALYQPPQIRTIPLDRLNRSQYGEIKKLTDVQELFS